MLLHALGICCRHVDDVAAETQDSGSHWRLIPPREFSPHLRASSDQGRQNPAPASTPKQTSQGQTRPVTAASWTQVCQAGVAVHQEGNARDCLPTAALGQRQAESAGSWGLAWALGTLACSHLRKKAGTAGRTMHLADVLRGSVLGPGFTEEPGSCPGPYCSPIVCTPQQSSAQSCCGLACWTHTSGQ